MDLKEYAKLFENGVKEFDNFCKRFLVEESENIVNQAKDRTPVDTGALRSSWYADYEKINQKEVDIKNSQEYASFIEYGTKRGIAPRNMVTVPLNYYNTNVDNRFKDALDDYFKEKGLK